MRIEIEFPPGLSTQCWEGNRMLTINDISIKRLEAPFTCIQGKVVSIEGGEYSSFLRLRITDATDKSIDVMFFGSAIGKFYHQFQVLV